MKITPLVFPIIGGMDFPTNPETKIKLVIKANSAGYNHNK